MESAVVWMILTVTFYEPFVVEGVCPQLASEAELRAKECLTSVGLDMDQSSNGGRSGDPDRLKELCIDGTLHHALECVENTVKECQEENEDVGNLLAKTISIHKLRSGFDHVCENTDILLEHSDCVADQSKPISQCIRIQNKRYQTQLKGQTDADHIWELSCGFMEEVFSCQETFYRQNCGGDVADVLATFMQSIKPPVCAQYNTGTAICLSIFYVSFVSFISIIGQTLIT